MFEVNEIDNGYNKLFETMEIIFVVTVIHYNRDSLYYKSSLI
jgi:hypothetical protein